MKTVDVEIQGINPLLVHRFQVNTETAKVRKAKIPEVLDTRAEALKAANVALDGTHWLSSFAVQLAIATAGSSYRQPNTRKSLTTVVQSAVRVITDRPGELPILVERTGKIFAATDELFEVDARPVTIPATKGRIMRYRPKYTPWLARFTLEIDETLIDVDTVGKLLKDAGVQIGIGDFRPQKKGPFGTFRCSVWEERKET